MNLESIIGQLFIIGFHGDRVTDDSPIVKDINVRNLGGVILFDRFLAENKAENNIISAPQVTQLTAELQKQSSTPLLISVDQEGGMVNRFKTERGFCETPPAEILGNSCSTGETEKAASQTADLLKKLGINFNLAPVVDLNTNPENPIIGTYKRSFSGAADQVVSHAATWIRKHRERNIHCCIKHFPGHGSAKHDSHDGFVDISDSWSKEELSPYRDLISQGLVESVMTGHLYNSNIDATHPATLSKPTLDILRQEFQFDGVILSDDLQMRAITDRYGLEEAACMALAAGVDIIVIGNNLDYDPDILTRLISAVANKVRSGQLSEHRITRAWQRVQSLKQPIT